MPDLLIVTGPPASGKTTLARKLAGDLGLYLLSRDDLKESLFDSLGWAERAWSQKLGQASFALLDKLAAGLLEAQQSLIVEANFDPARASESWRRILEHNEARVAQVVCWADPQVLLERFERRVLGGARHPGHQDSQNLAEQAARDFEALQRPLSLPGSVFRVDTTTFGASDYARLLVQLRAWVSA